VITGGGGAGKAVLFSDREAGQAGISTLILGNFFNCCFGVV